jgi:FkbM family methyltransferase
MFSQRDEEQVILEHFGDRVGMFLDIGAYDGKTFSNTHALALRGWAGVCVEASPSAFCKLMELYGDNLNIELVLATVVIQATSLVPLHDTPDALSSIDESHVEKWKGTTDFQTIHTATIQPQALYGYFPAPDFLSVDVEGFSVDVAKLYLSMWRPELVCVEVDDYGDVMDSFMAVNNYYERIHVTAENHIYRRNV